MSFKEITIKDLSINPFQSIGHDWFLITAGDKTKINDSQLGKYGRFMGGKCNNYVYSSSTLYQRVCGHE